MLFQKIVVGLYAHPENYPPTLNAIAELAKHASQIQIVHRPHREAVWEYPPEVELHPSGQKISPQQQERASMVRKIVWFVAFTWKLGLLLYRNKPACVLIYDDLALLSLTILYKLGLLPVSTVLWYHNHDLLIQTRKLSLSWWAVKSQNWIFPRLDIFTYPAKERLAYFPMHRFKGGAYFLPNYPRINGPLGQLKRSSTPQKELRLIYQGAITPGHGLEECIACLPYHVAGCTLNLTIIGPIEEVYRETLLGLVKFHNVEEKVEIRPPVPYAQLANITAQHHLGLAILTQTDNLNHQTAATASNKIVEYAAAGLPIVYFDQPSQNSFLGQFSWAFACDLSLKSWTNCLQKIIENYETVSQTAFKDFELHLNFESYFNQILITNSIPPSNRRSK